jgi:hypothetical protein
LEVITENGNVIYLVDGKDSTGEVVQFGITKNQLATRVQRRQTVRLVQFLNIVEPGLILAKHLFQGLKRPLCYGDDLNGDTEKLVYSWKPAFDYDWKEIRRFDSSEIERRIPPLNTVFFVIVTPNKSPQTYPSVKYWLEHWSWVGEAPDLASAPIDWNERYNSKLISYE